MKTTIIVLIIIVLAGLGIYFYTNKTTPTVPVPIETPTPVEVATTTPTQQAEGPTTIIGKSEEGRDIIAHNFGIGDKRVVLIGGIHGGYSWNTAYLGFEIVDYLTENPTVIPEGVKVSVIPVLNPDGLFKTTAQADRFTLQDIPDSKSLQEEGRFNANGVDLNRNFDCDWQADAVWQTKTVSGGDAAFSEAETLSLKNYIEMQKPAAVVAWYSAAGGVFASNCHGGVSEETQALTKLFADASGYKAYQEFDFYETTGDMTNWLAKIDIPATSVLLSTHTTIDWPKNKAGIDALLKYYGDK